MNKEIVLRMSDIVKTFPGVKALDGASLNIYKGRVMALMGENGAGKSTLIKVMTGIYNMDSGSLYVGNSKVDFRNVNDSQEKGIAVIHQELNLIPELSITENIFLGRELVNGFGKIDSSLMKSEARVLLDKLNVKENENTLVKELTIGKMQMVEIAKALSQNAKIIVMDEPTDALTDSETESLFKVIKELTAEGKSIVYISHRLKEIPEICDDITIMRDGKWIATESVKDLTTEQIINMMVGRDLTNRFPPKDNIVKEEILKVEGLTALHQPSIQDVTFELHKGEILGIAGLVGSKRTEIVETIFGMREKASGKITIKGKEVKNHNPNEAIANGFALVTEERRATGIYGMLDINFNSTISNLDRYKGKHPLLALLNDKGMKEDTQWVIDSMHVKTPSQNTSIGSLSGGNQQKVILGRWLLTEPDVLMLDEPTRGIDVLAKYEIYQLMIELAKKDKGIIMISSEMPELLGVTDRILVMSNGRVAGIVKTSETTQEEIMTLSAKYL